MTIPGSNVPEADSRRRFESLVLIHLDAAYTLARWLMKNDVEAQDVVQDAALRAYRHFDGMSGSSPRAWFMAIVRNVCFDRFESSKLGLKHETYDEEQHDPLHWGADRDGHVSPFEGARAIARLADVTARKWQARKAIR